ncbi:MAG: hypothetical protein ACOY46_15295 [Bacillota bacterium]
MNQNNLNNKGDAESAIDNITAIIEKYVEQIALLDVIDIVNNLRTITENVKGTVEIGECFEP